MPRACYDMATVTEKTNMSQRKTLLLETLDTVATIIHHTKQLLHSAVSLLTHFTLILYKMDQNQNPATPCSEHCAQSHLECLNMTNPDKRQSQSCSGTPLQSPAIPQPNFGAPNINNHGHMNMNIDDPFQLNNAPAVPNRAEQFEFGFVNLNDDDPAFRVAGIANRAPAPLTQEGQQFEWNLNAASQQPLRNVQPQPNVPIHPPARLVHGVRH